MVESLSYQMAVLSRLPNTNGCLGRNANHTLISFVREHICGAFFATQIAHSHYPLFEE